MQVGQSLNVWNDGKIVGAVSITEVNPSNLKGEASMKDGFVLPKEIEISVERTKTTIDNWLIVYDDLKYYLAIRE